MKKTIAVLFAVLFASSVSAQTIPLDGPFTATGSIQKTMRIIGADMATKGWNFDIKVTNNPVLSKKSASSSKTPFVLVWGAEINVSKSDKGYLAPPTMDNLIGMTHISNQFICGKKGLKMSDLTNKRKVYNFGVSSDPMLVNWVKQTLDHLGVKHKILKYQGSSKVGKALAAGEVDFILSSKGAKLQVKGAADCLMTAGPESIIGIPTLKSKFPKHPTPVLYNVIYWIGYNFDKASLNKFRADFQSALGNKDLVKMLNGRYASFVKSSLEEQVAALKKIDDNLAK